jgi:hypothetical protein
MSAMLLVHTGGKPHYRVDQTDFQLLMQAWRDGGNFDSVFRDARELGYGLGNATRLAMHARRAAEQESEINMISGALGTNVPVLVPEGTR